MPDVDGALFSADIWHPGNPQPATSRHNMATDAIRSTDPVMIMNMQSFLHDRLAGLSAEVTDWEDFYLSYNRIIQRFSVACGMQDCDVDECTQEVWLAVVHSLKSFELDSSRARFRSWLYRIVRNKAADLVRDRIKHTAISLNDSSRNFQLQDNTPPPLSRIVAAWKSEVLREAIAGLKERANPRDFAIFVERTVRKNDAATVAESWSLSEGAVRVVDHRLRKQLQEIINRLTDGDMVASFA